MVQYPPPLGYLISHRRICAIPHFATYRAIIVRYPIKTSTKEFCTTATSIARYGKYRCWASKTGVANTGCGKRPPIDDRNPIRKFSINCLDASKTNHQTRPQLTRHSRELKRKADTEFQYRRHRQYRHRLRTTFLQTPFPRLLYHPNTNDGRRV